MGCSRAGENVISRNVVRAPLLRMNDGGGIYTLGPQPRSSVRDNCIVGADASAPSLGPEGHSPQVDRVVCESATAFHSGLLGRTFQALGSWLRHALGPSCCAAHSRQREAAMRP